MGGVKLSVDGEKISLDEQTTVEAVKTEAGITNVARRIYFADTKATDTRAMLVFDDDFKYNPVTNILTVGSITGSAASASKLSSSAGSGNQPVYFSNGVPVACNHTISKSVPSNAVFTDTTYGVATQSANGLLSAADKRILDMLRSEPDVYRAPKPNTTGNVVINNWRCNFYKWARVAVLDFYVYFKNPEPLMDFSVEFPEEYAPKYSVYRSESSYVPQTTTYKTLSLSALNMNISIFFDSTPVEGDFSFRATYFTDKTI